ncbi:MAG: FAD:protein FMN transferase [Desulfitobacterium sp.]
MDLLINIKEQTKKRVASIAIVLLSVGLLAGCNGQAVQKEAPEAFEASGFAMGTIISQRVFGADGQAAIDETTEKLNSLEALLTFNAPGGDVNKLNENAGKQSVNLDTETLTIINKSLEVAKLSGGAFDVTIGPIVKSWGIGSAGERIPSDAELQKLLPLVNYQDLIIEGNTGYLKNEGQEVDLGGIAKGYAGDVAVEIYKKHGIESAFINLGGNVVTMGSKPDGSPWRVGVRNPRPSSAENGELVGMVEVIDKAVVTAGDDQRFFEEGGIRYHHILNPHTGYPAQSDLMSVTLITDSSLEADALDTAAFILGLERGRAMLEQYGGVEAIFITTDKKIYVTKGIKDSFEFNDASKEYEYVKE